MSKKVATPTSCCNGACCAAFTMSKYTVTQLAWCISRPDFRDEISTWPMMIPQTPEEHDARLVKFGYIAAEDIERAKTSGAGMWPCPTTDSYTCRNWDESTRLCTIYHRRPAMCKGFPYEGRCGDCGGMYETGRRGQGDLVQIGNAWERRPTLPGPPDDSSESVPP